MEAVMGVEDLNLKKGVAVVFGQSVWTKRRQNNVKLQRVVRILNVGINKTKEGVNL